VNAWRRATGATIEGFGDPVEEALVENVPLRERQRLAVEACGLTLGPPGDGPHLAFDDDLFFTAGLLEAVLARRSPGRPAILGIARSREAENLSVTQDAVWRGDALVYPLRWEVPGSREEPEVIVVDPAEGGFEVRKRMPPHVVASGEIVLTITRKSIVQIVTPLHLHLANLLSIMDRVASWRPGGLLGVALRLGRRFAKKPPPGKAPPAAFYKILRRMNRIGRNCDIHPTAVIEASVIGDNVRIGAGSYVQFSNLGDDVSMGPGNLVLTSSIGAGTCLVTREWVSLSVVGPGCFFAPRFIQFATVGRDAQVYPSMYYDFRLDGKPILTPFRGALVDARTEFVGPIIGHRARVAGGLALGPGRMVPNGVIVYPNPATVVNRFPPGLEEGDVVFAGQPMSTSKNSARTAAGGASPITEPTR
jgi:hypothetical protein